MNREKEIYKITIVGGVGNALLTAFKFAAGFLGNSAAMVADAVHSLSDFITDVIVLIFVRISSKPQDGEHQYGHGKFETLATALIGTALLAVGIGILVSSVQSVIAFYDGEPLGEPHIIALIAAALSIAVKEALYHYTARGGERLDSTALKANAWHHRSDALSSIGALLGIGGAILLGEQWRVLDPVAAGIVSVLIIKVAIDLASDSLGDLLERSLPKATTDEILAILATFPAVSSPHNLRTRRIGMRKAVDVHIRMDGETTVNASHDVTRAIEARLRSLLGQDAIITIHVEPERNPAVR